MPPLIEQIDDAIDEAFTLYEALAKHKLYLACGFLNEAQVCLERARHAIMDAAWPGAWLDAAAGYTARAYAYVN